MIESLMTINRGLAVLAALLPAVVWQWSTARGQSRGNSFFGSRVEAGFAESKTGVAILRGFRRRLWLCALAAAAASALIPEVALTIFTGPVSSFLAGLVAFALAHRRTQREAVAPAAPTVRVASLAAEEEPETSWLGVLDWAAMLVPPALPAATLAFLALHWNQLPAEDRGALRLLPVLFGLILGLMCAANQWALRFRARSSDWAPMPSASHKFRTYLGAMQAAVFAFITGQICVLAVMPLNGTVAWLRHLDLPTYFLISFPAQAILLVFVWRMHFWLKNHLATESSDPMSDTCWRWGYFYFNAGDPAMVVPVLST